MTHAEQEHQWRLLLEKENILKTNLNENSSPSAFREWWVEVERVFNRLRISQLPAQDPLPIGLFYTMSGFVGHLAVGDMPEPMSNVLTRGQTSPTPMERRDIRWAVTYRKAVELDIIEDRRPIQTIKGVYGVISDSAVRTWCREYEPFNDDLEIDDKDDAAMIILNRFHVAGKRYKAQNSRTEEAVKRGKKVKHSPKNSDKSDS
jgi:hypothetical protein